jgi:ATP-binding cassette subfamily C (CFTR/MRP) protein 1
VLSFSGIKLLGLVPVFISRLAAIRNDGELATLKRQGIALAYANIIWTIGPFMVTFFSLAAYSATQLTSLRPEIAFPAITLLNLLNQPLAAYPYATSAAFGALDAIRRISKFQLEDELQINNIEHISLSPGDLEAVFVEDAVFSWSEIAPPAITVPLLRVSRGLLYCVIGSVGSGKSTFLEAFNGAVYMSRGIVKIYGSVAYVPQVPWIFNGSIKDNILFGHEFEPDFYELVLAACALKPDLEALAAGDETLVGGQGMNLSGGQKVRVALARAIYAKADIYFLDDILAAVDVHVQKHLIQHVLGSRGILGGKTRILATNTTSILRESDHVFRIEEGKLAQIGRFRHLLLYGPSFGLTTVENIYLK